MTNKELRTLDEMLTNLEIWSTWNKTFANEMIGICSKMRNLLADRKTEPQKKEVEWVYNKRERLWYPYSNGELLFKTENSSEKPNNCEYAENPSGDVWECGCFLDTYCEHQIYDRNPDGTINIVECGYEPKDKPQTKCYLRTSCDHYGDKQVCVRCREYNLYSHTKTKPQTERSE